MAEDFYPQLCGGVFFNILLECKRVGLSARKRMEEGSDGLSEPQMLSGLIKVFMPGHTIPTGRSFSTQTTKYKQCLISNGTYLPFSDEVLIEAFDDLVKNHYTKAVARMKNFCNNFIDPARRTPRVNIALTAIVTTIGADESIAADQLFYIQPNGAPVTKSELCELSNVYIEPFLLGIWHFIVTQRKNNIVGADTITQWLPKLISPNRGDTPLRYDRRIVIVGENYDVPESKESESGEYVEYEEIENYDFTPYLQATKQKFSELKTLLYNDKPRKFYDFYVCNDICPTRFGSREFRLQPDIVSLTGHRVIGGSSHVVITGSGGLGKSMMMRHLLLDAIDNYSSTKLVPIFVPLKDYGTKYTDIFEYIYECLKKSCSVKKGQLEQSLKFGEIVLLLDGLDEIKTGLVNDYKIKLDKFIDDFPNTRIIMSSRPFQDFVEFRTFAILELQPFTKAQAIALIEKLEFRPDEPDFKEKFRKELDTRLFATHREFANNPLLLTIMLMTFEQFAEIPSKMHVFYREAYLALSQKHDASKGGYKRELKTKLSADRFADYLSEFCMRTYHDEKFEMTHEEFAKYFNSLKEHSRIPEETVTANDFLNDLKSGMCILYYESGKYHFTHRSFQEYFCALFFSKQKDKTLGAIGDFFEQKKRRMRGDMTFHMLYAFKVRLFSYSDTEYLNDECKVYQTPDNHYLWFTTHVAEGDKIAKMVETISRAGEVQYDVVAISGAISNITNGNKKRYAGLTGEKDYKKAVQIIKDGGYATSLTYVDKVCKIIEQWNLTKYDEVVSSASSQTPYPSVPFLVKVIIPDLNYRSEPSMNGSVKGQTGKGTFTIVEVKNDWGRLKSGVGWIYLGNSSYCTIAGAAKTTTKSVDELAREVIQGKWGNGTDRKNRLTAAGYDYATVQKRVNELLS